jgi:ATP-dependent DNA helicase DinG
VSSTPQPGQEQATAAFDAPSLHAFFGPGGLLSITHPAYEFRRGQLQMASAVEQALADSRHLIVEAGTGTGKTLGYLLPILRSGKRVIISTATKALQEQLFYKDVPFLDRVFFPNGDGHLRVCYMKGRNNYLCRQKLYDLTDQPILSGIEEIDQFRTISDWEKITETGDRAEIGTLPETSQLWPKLDARTEACTGKKCKQFERCFITEMKRRAAESDIIIVNHHLFFADLSIKQEADGAPDVGILPDCDAVIFDEAHELEGVAGEYFGVSVSNLRFEDLARDVDTTLRQKDLLTADIMNATARLRERANYFFATLPAGDGRFAFTDRDGFLEEHGDEYDSLRNTLARLTSLLKSIDPKPDEVHNFIRRADELAVQLSFVLESHDRNTVYWIERRGVRSGRGDDAHRTHPPLKGKGAAPSRSLDSAAKRGSARDDNSGEVGDDPTSVSRRWAKRDDGGKLSRWIFIQATPIDLSQILRQVLFDQVPTAVLTSATLAVNGGFDYIKARLGIQNARELVVPSHFDYATQAIFYVPPDMPDPRDAGFTARATDYIRAILTITRGRAFCLFTSYAQMHEIHDRLADELDFPVLLQGTAPKNVLLDEFRATPNSVLFATASFWQGVDVQGESLSCVIIDRLPFAVPNDPVVAARIRAINDGGGNAFFDYQVPSAVIALKQGFGRLIRSLNDRGVLVLLDNRIARQRYGRVFINSLPPYRRTQKIEDVEAFFE